MTNYIELDWETSWSPLYGKTIQIPENTILWRSYDTSHPAIGDRFAYYSSKKIAEGYKKNNSRELGTFVSSRPLKLLDYRFMKVILSRLIHTNSQDKSIQYLASIMLSFGLCSLRHQIELIKMRYSTLNKTTNEYKYIQSALKEMIKYYKPGNIIEQTGVRIAETTNDTYTMGFLQELFKDVFDGFISPRLYSPFHIEKDKSLMSPEIIIFNPKSSGIDELIAYPTKIQHVKIQELFYRSSGYILINDVKKNEEDMNITIDFYMCGGNKNGKHYLDDADDLLNGKDDNIMKIYNSGKKAGNKWNRKINITYMEGLTPQFKVTPFMNFDIGM